MTCIADDNRLGNGVGNVELVGGKLSQHDTGGCARWKLFVASWLIACIVMCGLCSLLR